MCWCSHLKNQPDGRRRDEEYMTIPHPSGYVYITTAKSRERMIDRSSASRCRGDTLIKLNNVLIRGEHQTQIYTLEHLKTRSNKVT